MPIKMKAYCPRCGWEDENIENYNEGDPCPQCEKSSEDLRIKAFGKDGKEVELP